MFYFMSKNLGRKINISHFHYFLYTGDSLQYHNLQAFSTIDRDNDSGSGHCANSRRGAWWYRSCDNSSLNAPYSYADEAPSYKGVYWQHWKGGKYSLKQTGMKIRRKR